jgi:copper chaperone CopZ
MNTINLTIDGMHCHSCVARVRRALEDVEDIRVKDVQIGSASIEADSPEDAIAAVAQAGYPSRRD